MLIQIEIIPVEDTSYILRGAICMELSPGWTPSGMPMQIRLGVIKLVSSMGMVSYIYTTYDFIHPPPPPILQVEQTSHISRLYILLRIQHPWHKVHIFICIKLSMSPGTSTTDTVCQMFSEAKKDPYYIFPIYHHERLTILLQSKGTSKKTINPNYLFF